MQENHKYAIQNRINFNANSKTGMSIVIARHFKNRNGIYAVSSPRMSSVKTYFASRFYVFILSSKLFLHLKTAFCCLAFFFPRICRQQYIKMSLCPEMKRKPLCLKSLCRNSCAFHNIKGYYKMYKLSYKRNKTLCNMPLCYLENNLLQGVNVKGPVPQHR